MPEIILDTHAVIRYFAEPQSLSTAATEAIKAAEASGTIYVSAIILIELVYLNEKGKIPIDVLDLLRVALDDSTTAFQLYDVNRAVADAIANIPRATVPDMPDRIIAATALHLNLPLVTRDTQIQGSSIQTIW